jgi:D-hydroxyproline dehydrogenase subunit gamma
MTPAPPDRRLPLPRGVTRGPEVSMTLDGVPLVAFEGETVAAAMLAAGQNATRTTVDGQARGIFCGIGVCFDCLVVVDGTPNTRACITWATDGMSVATQSGLSAAQQMMEQ